MKVSRALGLTISGLVGVIVCVSINFGFANGFSQTDYFVGSWIERETDGGLLDCPYSIEFSEPGEYVAYNDCIGDPRDPVTETGEWQADDDHLALFDRQFVVQQTWFSDDESITLRICEREQNVLTISYRGDCDKPATFHRMQ